MNMIFALTLHWEVH